jgi:hypothetical protein
MKAANSWRSSSLEWSWLFASMPMVLMGILLTHAVHLRLALGHWPYGFNDYPLRRLARMLLDIHELGLVVPGFWLTVLAIPLWFLSVLLARPTLRELARQVFVFLVGVIMLYGNAVLLSKTSYFVWLLD